MTENWLPIPGFEGRYEVSDQGRVRSLASGTPRLVSTRIGFGGYRRVTLYLNGRRWHRTVHVLVALAFIGPRPDGMEVRHLDGDQLNNCRSNLTYGTPTENHLDTVRHGRNPSANKTHCPSGHPYSPENTLYERKRPGVLGRRCRTCRNERQRAWHAMRAAS